MSKLKQMSIFAHIVEQGSVSAAAEKLELSKSVVSQHLKILEQELGASLLSAQHAGNLLPVWVSVFI